MCETRARGGGGGGGTPIYSLGGGVLLESQKSYHLLVRPNFANFVTLYQTTNAQLFLLSVFCEQSR